MTAFRDMDWSRRTQVIVLAVGLLVWGAALYWRATAPAPAPAAPATTEALGKRPGPRGEPGRRGRGPADAAAPRLRTDLLERPLPPLKAEVRNLFASVVPPPPPAPPARPPLPPPAPPPVPAGPPPPDPFLEAAKKLRVIALMHEDGKLIAFIDDGSEMHQVKKNDVIRARFLVKNLTDDVVVVSMPNGEKEVRLSFGPPRGAGRP